MGKQGLSLLQSLSVDGTTLRISGAISHVGGTERVETQWSLYQIKNIPAAVVLEKCYSYGGSQAA
jgi:hypothetical protein